MPIDAQTIASVNNRARQSAEQAQAAATLQLQQKQSARLKPGEKSIALPFGRRIAAKPYTVLRQSLKATWWLAEPEKLIKPEFLRGKYRLPDGKYCLAWPNSTEEGTTMGLAGSGFLAVKWNEIDTTLGARVRTAEGATTRKGEGFVYWKRLILVWVEPALWHESHVEPILRNLSLLARQEDDWAAHVEDESKLRTGDVLAQGLLQQEAEQVQIVTP